MKKNFNAVHTASSSQPYSISTSGSMRPDFINTNQANGSKNQNSTNSLAGSPTTPKHVPSFL